MQFFFFFEVGRREANEILVEMCLRVSSRTALSVLLILSNSVLSEILQPEPVHNYSHSEGKEITYPVGTSLVSS